MHTSSITRCAEQSFVHSKTKDCFGSLGTANPVKQQHMQPAKTFLETMKSGFVCGWVSTQATWFSLLMLLALQQPLEPHPSPSCHQHVAAQPAQYRTNQHGMVQNNTA